MSSLRLRYGYLAAFGSRSRLHRKGNLAVRFFIILAVVASALAAGAACAQESPLSTLSLRDAVSTALGDNPSLRQAQEGYLSAESRLRVAGLETTYGLGGRTRFEDSPTDSGVSGSIFGSLEYENLLGTSASVEFSPLGIGGDRGSIGLSIRHPLLSGSGRLSSKSDLLLGARSSVAIQSKELYRSRQATVVAVVEAYYQAVLAQERIKVQEAAVKIAEEALYGARRREEARLVTGIEVSRAETNLAQTRDTLNLQHQSAKGALDRLMLAIGVGIGWTPELTDRLPEAMSDLPDLNTAIKAALGNRAELTVYDQRLVDQERRLAIASDELRSRLDAVMGYQSRTAASGLASPSMFDSGSLIAGVEFTFPLDKRIGLESRDTASRELDLLKELRDYRADQVVEEVRRAYRSLQSAEASLNIYSQNLEAAQTQLHLAQRMVEEGEGSNREVLDAQNALTRVESGVLSARADLYLAGLDLLYAMGEDLTTVVMK